MTAKKVATKTGVKKTPKVIARPTLDRDLIIRFLGEQHCILWGLSCDISRSAGREKVADWLLSTIEQISSFEPETRERTP